MVGEIAIRWSRNTRGALVRSSVQVRPYLELLLFVPTLLSSEFLTTFLLLFLSFLLASPLLISYTRYPDCNKHLLHGIPDSDNPCYRSLIFRYVNNSY